MRGEERKARKGGGGGERTCTLCSQCMRNEFPHMHYMSGIL